MNTTQDTYLEIPPEDPRYRQLIRTAIKYRDAEALAALRGNTNKPIIFVHNWFSWALITSSHEQTGHVVIHSPQARLALARAHLHWTAQEDTQPDPLPIPLDIYDFLN